jgi:hypothetical protein
LFASFGTFCDIYPVILADKGTFALADKRGFTLFGNLRLARIYIQKGMVFYHVNFFDGVAGKTCHEDVRIVDNIYSTHNELFFCKDSPFYQVIPSISISSYC